MTFHFDRHAARARHAIYFAPAVSSAWWRFGAGWLGWDEIRGEALPQPLLHGIARDDFHTLVAEPRRYGFHATLKAPFQLRADVDEQALFARVDRLARQLVAVPAGPLEPVVISRFVALASQRQPAALAALAMRCVMDLEDLRAPMAPEEAARRSGGLTPRQRELLAHYGYPYVLEEFRFHMTLSAKADPATADRLVQGASSAVARLGPLCVDRLCVFREDHPGAPFLRVHEAELAA